MGWNRSHISHDQTTHTYQILQHLSLPLTGWKWILSPIWASVCVTYERKPLAVAVRVTRRRTGEISKCEREGKEECERWDMLQLIDFNVKKKKKNSRTMNNGATAYYQNSCKRAEGAKQTQVNMTKNLDLWEDQSHFVSSNFF